MLKSFLIALIIAVLAFAWVWTGMQGEKHDAPQDSPKNEALSAPKEAPSVQVQQMTAQNWQDFVTITGRSEANRQVFISSETNGTIATLAAKRGDRVATGQVLAKLDVQDRAAKVQEARQLIAQRKIQLEAAQKLSEKGFASDVRLAEAKAQLETAKAQLEQAQVELENIAVKAPFDGVINDNIIEVGDFVNQGTQLFDLVDLDPITIKGFLTEKQLVKIEEGSPAQITFLDGREAMGTIAFIASAADPDTRTFAFEVTAPNPEMVFKDGLTANIQIATKEVQAYQISPSILTLADDGTVGVKIVDEQNIVRLVPIRLLKDTKDFLWIGGLPNPATVITVGQEFVVDGQTVKPVFQGGSKNP